MASIFVEGRAGEDDFKSIWAGLRVYFGTKDKSSIRRHREDVLSDTVIGFAQSRPAAGGARRAKCLIPRTAARSILTDISGTRPPVR